MCGRLAIRSRTEASNGFGVSDPPLFRDDDIGSARLQSKPAKPFSKPRDIPDQTRRPQRLPMEIPARVNSRPQGPTPQSTADNNSKKGHRLSSEDDSTVDHAKNPSCPAGNRWVMSDEHHRATLLLLQTNNEVENRMSVLAIEITGRFIRKEQRWLISEDSARWRHAVARHRKVWMENDQGDVRGQPALASRRRGSRRSERQSDPSRTLGFARSRPRLKVGREVETPGKINPTLASTVCCGIGMIRQAIFRGREKGFRIIPIPQHYRASRGVGFIFPGVSPPCRLSPAAEETCKSQCSRRIALLLSDAEGGAFDLLKAGWPRNIALIIFHPKLSGGERQRVAHRGGSLANEAISAPCG